jgi:peptidoglycan/xylan/chitin deacetylase (PgdA/CDA1 family)
MPMTPITSVARAALTALDDAFAALGPQPDRPNGVLVSALFHEVHADRGELASPLLAPNQGITLDDLRRFLDAMLESGYRPVSPLDVDAGLAPGGKHLLITFDDGYFNNARVLDVLEQFQAPAIFFISSGHVLQGKGFWWDALSRELRERGAGERAVRAQLRQMKAWTHDRIESCITTCYGPRALEPRGDLDRPFTGAELRDLSHNPWVHLGNHTRDHAILPNYTPAAMQKQIEDCQRDIAALTGREPIAIAYPNGDYSREAVEAARAAGLRLGLTVRPSATQLPLDDAKARMTLGRYLVSGGEDFRRQCRKINARFIPGHMLKSLRMSGY